MGFREADISSRICSVLINRMRRLFRILGGVVIYLATSLVAIYQPWNGAIKGLYSLRTKMQLLESQ